MIEEVDKQLHDWDMKQEIHRRLDAIKEYQLKKDTISSHSGVEKNVKENEDDGNDEEGDLRLTSGYQKESKEKTLSTYWKETLGIKSPRQRMSVYQNFENFKKKVQLSGIDWDRTTKIEKTEETPRLERTRLKQLDPNEIKCPKLSAVISTLQNIPPTIKQRQDLRLMPLNVYVHKRLSTQKFNSFRAADALRKTVFSPIKIDENEVENVLDGLERG